MISIPFMIGTCEEKFLSFEKMTLDENKHFKETYKCYSNYKWIYRMYSVLQIKRPNKQCHWTNSIKNCTKTWSFPFCPRQTFLLWWRLLYLNLLSYNFSKSLRVEFFNLKICVDGICKCQLNWGCRICFTVSYSAQSQAFSLISVSQMNLHTSPALHSAGSAVTVLSLTHVRRGSKIYWCKTFILF